MPAFLVASETHTLLSFVLFLALSLMPHHCDFILYLLYPIVARVLFRSGFILGTGIPDCTVQGPRYILFYQCTAI